MCIWCCDFLNQQQQPGGDEFADMWAQLQDAPGLLRPGGPRGGPPQGRDGDHPRGLPPQQGPPSLQQAARALPTAPLPSHQLLGGPTMPTAQVPNKQRQAGTGRTRPPKQKPQQKEETAAASQKIDVQQLFSTAQQGPSVAQPNLSVPPPAPATASSLADLELMMKGLQKLDHQDPPQRGSKVAGNLQTTAPSTVVSLS